MEKFYQLCANDNNKWLFIEKKIEKLEIEEERDNAA